MEVMKFAQNASSVPMWLALTYLSSNLILHTLNFYWFGRMIETVRKRFQGKEHDEFKHEREKRQSLVEELADGLDESEISGPRTPGEEGNAVASGVDGGSEIGKRRKDL